MLVSLNEYPSIHCMIVFRYSLLVFLVLPTICRNQILGVPLLANLLYLFIASKSISYVYKSNERFL